MDDGLFSLEDSAANETQPASASLYPAQRQVIRELFGELGVTEARAQFDLVEKLTGVRIVAVQELDAATANVLIPMLRGAAARAGHANTGNAWADRAEDTWIDRL